MIWFCLGACRELWGKRKANYSLLLHLRKNPMEKLSRGKKAGEGFKNLGLTASQHLTFGPQEVANFLGSVEG